MATSNFPIYNYYILYTIYYILYLIYIYTLHYMHIILYIIFYDFTISMVYIIDFIIYDIVFYEFPIEIPFCLFGFRSAMMRPGPPPGPRLGAIGSARPRRAAFRIGRSRNWWRLQMLGEFSTGTAKPVEHGEFTNQNIRFFMGFIWKIP